MFFELMPFGWRQIGSAFASRRLQQSTGVSFVEPVFMTGIGVIVSGLVPRNTRVNLHTKKAYIATIYNLMYLLLLRGAIIFSLLLYSNDATGISCCF
jgi:hypothetical protein